MLPAVFIRKFRLYGGMGQTKVFEFFHNALLNIKQGICRNCSRIGQGAADKFNNGETGIGRGSPANTVVVILLVIRILHKTAIA